MFDEALEPPIRVAFEAPDASDAIADEDARVFFLITWNPLKLGLKLSHPKNCTDSTEFIFCDSGTLWNDLRVLKND